ncbi:MAG TPA: universal stress protein [Nitrospiraceae bacterium]|nr:universal stress protein [Nitrospiraceae bacterium]
MISVPLLQHVFHPSDFTEASAAAFAHALKAALVAKADLTMMHVAGGEELDWAGFPGVRETLERWGLLPPNSPRNAVPKLGIDVKKIITRQADPVEAVVSYLGNHAADLLVLATNQNKGRMQWLEKSVATPVAIKSRLMTLFIPHGIKGFVSLDDGSVSLRRILIPIDTQPDPLPAVQAAVRIALQLNCPAGTFTLLHVGGEGQGPEVPLPDVPGWDWERATKQGAVTDVILETARERTADLIVMSTEGRNGFLDVLRGSQTERVLRGASCPLLAIPATSWMAAALQSDANGDG